MSNKSTQEEKVAMYNQRIGKYGEACPQSARWTKDHSFEDVAAYHLNQIYSVRGISSVLDLGCGNGITTRLIAKHVVRMVGVDNNPTFISFCKIHEQQNTNWELMDIDEYLQQADNDSFDWIVSTGCVLGQLDCPNLLEFEWNHLLRVAHFGFSVIVADRPETNMTPELFMQFVSKMPKIPAAFVARRRQDRRIPRGCWAFVLKK